MTQNTIDDSISDTTNLELVWLVLTFENSYDRPTTCLGIVRLFEVDVVQ